MSQQTSSSQAVSTILSSTSDKNEPRLTFAQGAYTSTTEKPKADSQSGHPGVEESKEPEEVDGPRQEPQVSKHVGAPQDQMLLLDDEDDDSLADDGDEDEEENFYSKHPSDFKNSLNSDKIDLGADIKVSKADFNDFDDHEALRASEFYSKSNKTHKQPPSQNKPSDKYEGQESGYYQNSYGQANQCALILERGPCLTYNHVEWAISRARRLLRFQMPDDLRSSEISEASVNSVGELNEWTTALLARRFQLDEYEINVLLGQLDVRRTSLWPACPTIYRQQATCLTPLSRYRTHTGQCNNLFAPHLGSSYMPFNRLLPAQYADLTGMPRRSTLTGSELPLARLVALHLHPDVENLSSDLSVLFMSWGQLVNHDLAMASGARVATGHSAACCRPINQNDDDQSARVCMPIRLDAGDPLYAPLGIRCMDFKRSLAGLRPGCPLGPRTQLNTITSFIDASFVYGSRRSMTASLRRNSRGELNVWNYFRSQLKPLLPPQVNEPDEECIGRRRGLFCFQSGDPRTNQQIQLAALHTFHTRQHNRLANGLAVINPHWSDNKLYHEARHIHIALVQHILLSEYLPVLLGEKTLAKYDLLESGLNEYWDHYDPSINPSISQAFAAAAFRQGHTTVPGEVFRFSYLHEPTRVYKLRQLFRQPWALFEPGAMDEFLLGMVNAPSESFDPFLSQELSGHLLQDPAQQVGLDLTAINIQRGRDQGVANYVAFRDWCNLKPPIQSFADLLLIFDNQTVFMMESLYESVYDIDLFTGGISEPPIGGGQVGETFACIIGRQFQALRLGDRFWFESSQGAHAFSLDQLNSIKQVSLARILCVNSDAVATIQQFAFHLPHPVYNPHVPCDALADLDITLWFEPRLASQPQQDDDDDD